jgi:rod shape determining protein RodA
MTGQFSTRDFDWTLIGLAMAICTLGLLEVYSATRNTRWQDAHYKQLVWIGIGLILLWIVSMIDYNWLVEHVFVFYAIGVALLIVVLVIAKPIGGARRWLPLPGGGGLQVSEFLKVVLVLLMARLFSDLPQGRLTLPALLKMAGLFALPMLLVLKQPDLSTALSYLPILAIGVFLAGVPWKYVAAGLAIAVLVLPLGWQHLKPYQQDRVLTFLNPDRDPLGSGYQPIQSKIAVGSGGIWGRGFARGEQTQLRFLPVPHTDFVFSAYAEETGFIGVVLALSLYLAILMKIVSNAQTAADTAGGLICMGAAAVILFHIGVNIGMVIGRMPVTGIPLPLMSYGGSNLLTIFLMLGLVNNVRLRRFTN